MEPSSYIPLSKENEQSDVPSTLMEQNSKRSLTQLSPDAEAQAGEGGDGLGLIKCDPEPLPEGIYGAMIACYIRDLHRLDRRLREARGVKHLKIVLITAITFFALGLQFFIIFEVKSLVTPAAVLGIRQAYGKYEGHMYTDDKGVKQTVMSKDGHERGIVGYFRPDNFHSFEPDLKESVCRVPLSQPHLTSAVVFIWTLTCLAELRKVAALLIKLLLVPTGANQLEKMDPEESNDGEGPKVIASLSIFLKLVVTIIMSARFLMCLFLLWLGCRWLLATDHFGDILLNAIALEFILLIRDLLWNTVVPYSRANDTVNTFVPFPSNVQKPDCATELGMFALIILAAIWTYVYMYHLQMVLPEYRWDIHAVCEEYLAEHLSVSV